MQSWGLQWAGDAHRAGGSGLRDEAVRLSMVWAAPDGGGGLHLQASSQPGGMSFSNQDRTPWLTEHDQLFLELQLVPILNSRPSHSPGSGIWGQGHRERLMETPTPGLLWRTL